MFSKLRGRVGALALCALLTATAAPASSASLTSSSSLDERSVPVMMDALFLRPIGLMVTLGGAALYAVSVPFVALTRPSQIGTPLEQLVLRPARFTFVDPLGEH